MTSELDERYSDAGTTAVPWGEVRQALADAQLSWITTVRDDGRPHVTPLVAVWLDDSLYFGTGPHEQKAKNLATNSQVVVTTGCNTWDRGLDVVVEGEATRVTDRATLERLRAAWGAKWDGRWKFDVGEGVFEHQPDDYQAGAEPALVFAILPATVLAFGKGLFTHTRYTRA
jgi:general stress protein 26